ncbi:TIGR00341 family protein [Psychrobacter sp. 1U2]|uniref:TIGR00341 family protein n=1 Tax=Psychrobacter sp. 1U2 TaxID=3453577 RepID=UPI003F44A3AE
MTAHSSSSSTDSDSFNNQDTHEPASSLDRISDNNVNDDTDSYADRSEPLEPQDEEKINTAEAGSYHSESKVTMTAISEEVVVATVEDSTPEIVQAQATNSETANIGFSNLGFTNIDFSSLAMADLVFTKAKSATAIHNNLSADKTLLTDRLGTSSHGETADIDSDQPSDLAPSATPTDEELIKNSNKIDMSSNKDTGYKDVKETENDSESAIEEENEKEEVQEKKEAKLESYKQFVAEQFSNQKVDYPEVRVKIEANALPSKMYFIMNVLSAIIASYGLVTNSAAVVIGAMLVAMMLGPITGVALAIIDHRMPLLWKSLFTVIAGISLVVLVGFLIGLLHNDQPLTAEILSRTQPTSMDLMIALAGGTAGAYAMVSPHLSVAVVGVAVATALVPPLAASGILFAHSETQLGLGALLLAITNIIAIQFTNALVLWLLGFRRLVDDDYKSKTYLTFLRRNAVTLLLLAGLGTYLTINLQTNAKQQVFESSTKEAINNYFIDKGNVLTNTQFDTSDENQVVRAVIRGESTPSSYDVQQIEALITADMAENFPEYLPIKLQLRYLPVQVIEANPLTTDQLDKTDAAILTN